MNVIVTGASGFVGRRLCRDLAAAGISGIAVSRRPIDSLPPGWQWRERAALLAERDSVAVGDVVVHLEVKHHVATPNRSDCAEFTRVNVEGTEEWLRWCDDRSIARFIYFSSIKAVGASDCCQDEAVEAEPATPYGQSKREGERRVRRWAEQAERRALILRPAVVYGPGSTANIFAMVRAIDRGVFFFAGENVNVKSLVSLRNVTAAVVYLIPRLSAGCNIFNLVDRTSCTVREIATAVTQELGRPQLPRTLPLSLLRPTAALGDFLKRVGSNLFPINSARLDALIETTYFSPEKLTSTGFVHPQTTREGLREMVAWYREAKADGFRSLEGSKRGDSVSRISRL